MQYNKAKLIKQHAMHEDSSHTPMKAATGKRHHSNLEERFKEKCITEYY